MALLDELTPEECVDLLRVGLVGRVALTTPDGLHIVPVNYTVVDGGVLVATSPYSVLGTYGRGSPVAFETDGIDAGAHEGWSVVVRGRAEVVDPSERGQLGGAVPQPWADGVRAMLLRIPFSELSGRRLGRSGAGTTASES